MIAEAVRIIATGGTFDKQYNEIAGELSFDKTHIPGMLKRGRCALRVEIETPMMIDSLQMTRQDRERIFERCAAAKERRIVITHGTDTMEETAAVVGTRAAGAEIGGKTIVLTGAMVPYAFGSSDGMFNLGAALAFAQSLPPGVYVAMNGRYFPWNSVTKNKELGVFESTEKPA